MDTKGKYAKMKAEGVNPFIDATAWGKRLDYCKKQFDDMIAAE